MEIPFKDIQLGHKVGEGGFGCVYKANWRGSPVAVKKLIKEVTNANLLEFKKELQTLMYVIIIIINGEIINLIINLIIRKLRHPNIVLFMGACTIPPHFAFVTGIYNTFFFSFLSFFLLIFLIKQCKNMQNFWKEDLCMIN